MSTLLRICTLLLFVVLGAGLALCVAGGLTLNDALALARGDKANWPWASAATNSPNDAEPSIKPESTTTTLEPAPASTHPRGEPPSAFTPASDASSPSLSAISVSSPASNRPPASADAGTIVEPRHLPEAPARAESSRRSAAATAPHQPDDAHESANGARGARADAGNSCPSRSARDTTHEATLCADPPEDQQTRLISIIHELVKQPRVQPVSAVGGDFHPRPVSAHLVDPASAARMAADGSSERVAAAAPPARPGGELAAPQNAPGLNAASPTTAASLPARPAKSDASAAPNVRITQTARKSAPAVEPIGEGASAFQIFVKDEDIRQVLAMLGEAGKLNILPSSLVTGNVSLSLGNVTIDEALDAILKSKGLAARREGRFIYVGTPEEFVARDKRNDRLATRIYRPNYVTAAEIKNLLTPLLTPTAGKISVTAAAKSGIESNDNQAGGNDLATREAVLVQDFQSVLAQMDRVVLEIDRRPLQVAIEAMILSVKLDDQHQCGVDFQFLRNQGTVKLGLGAPAGDLGDVGFVDGGLKFAYLDGNIAAFVKALETVGDTNVISTPRLLTLNKQRAEILIGSELGYVSTTVTETSSTQNINFLEVGTQLRIRPFISADGMIRMEIHPELSTGQVRVESGLTLPDKEVTKVTTNIMIRDGSTVIIGGLMREDLTKNARRIPWLGAMPAVGWLFGAKDEKTERQEILVLVTPRIVCDDEMNAEASDAACEFHRRQNVFGDSMSPLGRTYLARKYFRLAQEAWATGDGERATRFINLSIHMNPGDRAAIDLRSDIAAGLQFGKHTLQPGAPVTPAMPDGPPVFLNENALDQGAPQLLPPGATEIPTNRLPTPAAPPGEPPSPTADRPTPPANTPPADAPPAKPRTARKPAFPVRPSAAEPRKDRSSR